MKKSMVNLSIRLEKLNARADKLKGKKQKEEKVAAEKKEKEQERERQLMAQPSKELLEKQQNTPNSNPLMKSTGSLPTPTTTPKMSRESTTAAPSTPTPGTPNTNNDRSTYKVGDL